MRMLGSSVSASVLRVAERGVPVGQAAANRSPVESYWAMP
jgi:hypothetical protein